MDEFTADVFVNRDEPIPVIGVPGTDSPSSDPPQGNRERLKESRAGPTSKSRDKRHESSSSTGKESAVSLQDRLLTKLLQQVLPDEQVEAGEARDESSCRYINRPGFSLPLMATNFRRFNARVGVIFVFQNRVERLLTWQRPSHTLSLLAVCTFACLKPHLIPVMAITAMLCFVFVPAYLARHPPPPQTNPTRSMYSLRGPPLAPPRTFRPVSEMSKDFFRNMRDLQNCMDDFSTIHDTVVNTATPLVNFSDEKLSSALFDFLLLIDFLLLCVGYYIPWRFVTLMACWTSISMGHPAIRTFVLSYYEEYILPHQIPAQGWIKGWIEKNFILDESPETNEVQIFELQRRRGGRNGEWESWMFSSTAYDPLSSQRIAGERPHGNRFFEDVGPPGGWKWNDKKWVLDLDSQGWAEEQMVQGVEVEIEGERWVTDLAVEEGGDEKADAKGVAKGSGEGMGGRKVGDWRRRRWVRSVQRKAVGEE